MMKGFFPRKTSYRVIRWMSKSNMLIGKESEGLTSLSLAPRFSHAAFEPNSAFSSSGTAFSRSARKFFYNSLPVEWLNGAFKLAAESRYGKVTFPVRSFSATRAVAQLGRALPWGGRGRGFKSRRSDPCPINGTSSPRWKENASRGRSGNRKSKAGSSRRGPA